MNDLRYALRTLRTSPGFTTVALLTLALGIGGNTAIFSIISATFYRPLPFAEPSRLAAIVKHFKPTDYGQIYVDPPTYLDWTADTNVFSGAALFTGTSANLSTADRPDHVDGTSITPGMFDLLGVRPALGRSFLSDEGTAGRDHVVILSDALWRERFAGHILGRQVSMNGALHTVVGVMPPGFSFPDQAKFWVPLVFDPVADRGNNWVNGIVRLRPGVTVAAADAYLNAVSRRLEQQYPLSNTGVSATLAPLQRLLGVEDAQGFRSILFLMLGAVGFVLLIACANLATLLLTRATTRRHEIGIREALGASRSRLVRQFLTESALVALSGGALGLLVATWALGLFVGAIGQNVEIPYWLKLTIDWRGLFFTAAVALGTGVAVGVLPALRATRFDVRGALQEGARGSGRGIRGGRLRSGLVVAEVVLAMVLVVAAGLLIRTVVSLAQVDPGFDAAHAFTAYVDLGGSRNEEVRARSVFFSEFTKRIEALPGVRAAGAINLIPLRGINYEGVKIEGQTDSPEPPLVSAIAGHYVRALGLGLREGREFTEAEDERGGLVAMINATMARHYWPRVSALGRRFRFGRDPAAPWWTVVGVAPDIKQGSLAGGVRDQVYVPRSQRYSSMGMSAIVRTAGDPMRAVAMVRSELARIDPAVTLNDIRPMQDIVWRSFWDKRLYGGMFSIFAAVGLMLAAIGIYGVIAYAAAQRTHEIGVRIALGAAQRDVLRLVVGQGVRLAAAGVGVGAVGAIGLTRALSSLLYGVSPLDPVSFVVTALLLGAVAMLASYVPARRATKVDPMVALRYE